MEIIISLSKMSENKLVSTIAVLKGLRGKNVLWNFYSQVLIKLYFSLLKEMKPESKLNLNINVA